MSLALSLPLSRRPDPERPRERCLRGDPSALSLRECLAILLGSGPRSVGCLGVATEILERCGAGMANTEQERAFFLALEASPLSALEEVRGLGDAGKARILASLELARRYSAHRAPGEPYPESDGLPLSQQAVRRIPGRLRLAPREWLGFVAVLRAGRSRRLSGLCQVATGTRDRVQVDPVELFARLLALRPEAFFLFHNHPSGDSTPSADDHDLTDRVTQVSRQLGVTLLGHAVVTAEKETWIELGPQKPRLL